MRQLLPFEFRYHFRHLSFPFFSFILLGAGILFAGRAFTEPALLPAASYSIALRTAFLSMLMLFIIMIMAVRVLHRDEQHLMTGLVGTTPIGKAPFMGSRLTGLLVSALVLFTICTLGQVAYHLFSNNPPPDCRSFVMPMVLFGFPNVLFCTALLFATASLSKAPAMTYVSALALYILYWVCSYLAGSPLLAGNGSGAAGDGALLLLADPFGIMPFIAQTRTWDAAMKNTYMIRPAGILLYNRLVWMAVSIGLLTLSYHLFDFRKKREKVRRKEAALPAPAHVSATYSPGQVAIHQAYESWYMLWKSTLYHMRMLLHTTSLRLALVIWALMVVVELIATIKGGGEYGSQPEPVTGLLIDQFKEPLKILGRLLIVYYAAEVVHREQTVRLSEISRALPVSSFIQFITRWLTVCLIPALMTGVAALLTLAVQVVTGPEWLEGKVLLSLLYTYGMPLYLFSLMAVTIQWLVHNRYLGMGISILGGMLSTSLVTRLTGVAHPMLMPGRFPDISYGDMTGYFPRLLTFHSSSLYWLGWLGLFAIVSIGIKDRQAISRLRMWPSGLVAGTCIIVLLTGTVPALYSLYEEDPLLSAEAKYDLMASYEKTYHRYRNMPEPEYTALTSEADLYPEEGTFSIRHQYTLTNTTDSALSVVWFTVPKGIKVDRLELGGHPADTVDDYHGVYWFRLARPLAPNESILLAYDISGGQTLYSGTSWPASQMMARSGSNLMNPFILPSIGYKGSMELSLNRERIKRGLMAKKEEAADAHLPSPEATGSCDYRVMDFRTTISTSAGQTALAPGMLKRSWKEGDRQYFMYESKVPIGLFFSYISGYYAMDSLTDGNLSYEVYYHPSHGQQVPAILRTMKETAAYCRRTMGPYQRPVLRLAEIPAHWQAGGYAGPGLIGITENRGFTSEADKQSFHILTKRVAHETAHQWLGQQLTTCGNKGGAMIVESLTKYIEAEMMASLHGTDMQQTLLQHDMDAYISQRYQSGHNEPPLESVENEHYIYYYKGGVAFQAISKALGKEVFEQVLQGYYDQHAYPRRRGSAHHFSESLIAASPDSMKGLVREWLSEVTTYDLQLIAGENMVNKRGERVIHLTIDLSKQQTGQTKSASEGRWVDLEISLEAPKGLLTRSRKRLFIQPGEHDYTLKIPAPARAVILDPDICIADRDREDNTMYL